jgi:hypothetical protein
MKVGTNRATVIVDKIVHPTQSDFIPGRNILEGVVILHKTINEIHRKKVDMTLFKLIFKRHIIKLNGLFFNNPCV